MKKKTYNRPVVKTTAIDTEQLMIGASPGVGGPFDPGKEIESKGSDFFDEDMDADFEGDDYTGFAHFWYVITVWTLNLWIVGIEL